MTFPEAFLEQLHEKISLANLIGRSVQLARSGKQWKGCCPFHSEKTPSFYVYDDQHYHCFGCGAHGNAIHFMMKSENLSFDAVVKQLATEAGMTLPGSPADVEPTKLLGNAKDIVIFKDGKIEALLATAAKILVHQERVVEASILANGATSIALLSHNDRNGGQDTWRLFIAIPVEIYLELENREDIQRTIAESIAVPLRAVSNEDFIEAEITTLIEQDPDWRQKIRQRLSGEGINNQGRVHSQNIAARAYDNLLFRSRPEIFFYQALRTEGVAFAPLAVVVGRDGVGQKSRRIEPDFVIFKDGQVTIVEIDGDLYHTETPHAAHLRLKFLTDEGARLERLNANECDTGEKAREAVGRVLMDIEKRRRARH